jgi:hypothetical protein
MRYPSRSAVPLLVATALSLAATGETACPPDCAGSYRDPGLGSMVISSAYLVSPGGPPGPAARKVYPLACQPYQPWFPLPPPTDYTMGRDLGLGESQNYCYISTNGFCDPVCMDEGAGWANWYCPPNASANGLVVESATFGPSGVTVHFEITWYRNDLVEHPTMALKLASSTVLHREDWFDVPAAPVPSVFPGLIPGETYHVELTVREAVCDGYYDVGESENYTLQVGIRICNNVQEAWARLTPLGETPPPQGGEPCLPGGWGSGSEDRDTPPRR